MSYASSAALQAAVFNALSTDAGVTALVGSNIFDALPTGTPPSLYVSIGPETARDASDKGGAGALHSFTVSVVTDVSGFQTAKTVAAAICDALVGQTLTLTRGSLVGLWFDRSKAARTSNDANRRIDLRFRARIDGI
ncbi:MAG: DUF3168 domain-containing protein [Pseudomonadota bacterium]